MFLKSLTLKGFKSFADSTTLQLEPGVTVVVGPNGSGKSNVVDAIAWVLGAQAPKSVRSQKMDDVIFAGTATRPALGRAEVTLTIDNSAGLLGVELSEITISRILFRTGESEYAINGVPCRLLDVQELLSDAGVGRQQHVIVSQGQIDAVLNARPEDRRAIVEEAAGVLKYRKRKEKAERRLEATEANLLRVQDLLREVRRQLRPLERQAEAAQRHGDLMAELTGLRVYVAGREIAALRARLEALSGERLDVARREEALRTELARLDTAVMSIEAELTARGESDLGDRLVRVEQLRERARGLAAVLAERRRSMERDRGQLLDAGVVAQLESDVAQLRAELVDVDGALESIHPDLAALEDDEAAFAAERDAAVPLLSDEATSRAASAAAEVRGELRSIRMGLERAEADRRRALERRGALEQRIAACGAELDRLRAECAAAEDVEGALVTEVESAESAVATATAELGAARTELQQAAEAASGSLARVEALQQALDEVHARAGAERLAEVDGVVGTLLDVVAIDEGWEAAVEAALGDALTAVVVSGPDAARSALRTLGQAGMSGAVLPAGRRRAAATAPAGGRLVRSHVRAVTADVEALLDAVIGHVVVVDDAMAAVDVALDHPDAVIVTRAGDRFAPTGWRLGAAAGGATAAALAEARERADEATARHQAAARRASEADSALREAERRRADVTRRLDVNDARFTAASESLARVNGERRELLAETESVDRAAAELDEVVVAESARAAELERVLPALELDEAAELDESRRRDEMRAALEARAALLASRRRELEVRSAGLRERRQLVEARLADTERRLAADADARRLAEERRTAAERSLVAVDRLTALVRSHQERVEVEHTELAEQRRRQSDEVRARAVELDRLRRERAEQERSLEAERERSRRADIEHAEVTLRLETAVETVRRDLDTEPDAAVAAPEPHVESGVSPAERVRVLERELRLLGPINPLALEEFTELQQRHAFLEEQLDDVRSTRRDLSRVISAVDQEIQQVFAAAFADVSANFTQLFANLFPGGVGRLVLTNPDHLLDTGIEVEAKPSGKNVKKLSLLSGGERSLTALAFLFAVFRSRPSPFYVMDEVEAALDDVNLHRFLGLIAEFRREAQLIIVSHQKRTMEAGDSLLGVSMQPGGSSKVVVERVASPT